MDDLPAPEELSAGPLAEESDYLAGDITELDMPDNDELQKTDDEPSFDTAALDLSGAIIDEPDLSGEISEMPLTEPSLDALSIDDIESVSLDIDDLDQVENTGTVLDEAELPLPEENAEIENTVDENAQAFDQVIPEGFMVEDSEQPSVEDEADVSLSEDFAAAAAKLPVADIDDGEDSAMNIPAGFKHELKTVLSYMDHLLESLPEEKIEEFAKSEYFDTYKKLFKELGLV
jgi:hypothetical protein